MKIKTFEEIMSDMLERLPDKYDKRQGSMLYNLLAPCAQELAIQYTVLDECRNSQFLDTAYGDFLTRLAKQFGVDRLSATASIREATFAEPIPLGTRFSVVDSEYNFRVLEAKGGDTYLLVAEQLGSGANVVEGSLLNIDELQEFSNAAIGQVIIPGEDEETDEALRKRTIAYIKTPTLNGNIAQYEKWASEFEGVGSALIQPLWNGPNTVKVSITNANGEEASNDLVERFQKYLDPEPKGHGKGVAPLGAYVTVASVSGFTVSITVDVKIEEDADIDAIRRQAFVELSNYLRTEAFNEKEVRTYKVATIIDRLRGVKDVDNLRINEGASSIELTTASLPKLSEVVLNVR